MTTNLFYPNDVSRQKMLADFDILIDAIAARDQAAIPTETTLPENNDDIMSSEPEEI